MNSYLQKLIKSGKKLPSQDHGYGIIYVSKNTPFCSDCAEDRKSKLDDIGVNDDNSEVICDACGQSI